jgi:hypothetical protein
VGLDQRPHEGQGGGVAARLAAARVGPGRNLARGASPVPQLLEEGLAHAEQGRQGALRPEVLIVGRQDFLSEVERIGFHAS